MSWALFAATAFFRKPMASSLIDGCRNQWTRREVMDSTTKRGKQVGEPTNEEEARK